MDGWIDYQTDAETLTHPYHEEVSKFILILPSGLGRDRVEDGRTDRWRCSQYPHC